jgi:arylsulfatase A-like enzyme
MKLRLLAAWALAVLFAAGSGAAAPPNFIFILADDLGWTTLAQRMDDRVPDSRSDFHATPALERLARRGLRFTHGYAPDALCCPTRRSIQFGQTPVRQGDARFPAVYGAAKAERLTIPRALKAADPRYRTAHYGKWDLRAEIFPEDLGYDESDGNTGNRHGDVALGKDSKWTGHHLNDDPKRIATLTDRAVNFLRRNRAAGTPFYLQVSHYATHVDMQARAETFEKFSAKTPGRIHTQAAWAAMLADLDAGIGRLLDEVDRLGLAESTYIVFMADNGGVESLPPVANKLAHPSTHAVPLRNHPLRAGKWTLYEGGIRVPFIVAGPGVKAGGQCDVPVVGWDLLPTFADLAGSRAPLPADLDGASFRPLLADGTGRIARPDAALVFHRYASRYPHSAIRVGDLKLVKIWKTDALELYDLKADLGETTDLAAQRPDTVRALHDRLMVTLRRLDAEVLHGFGKPAKDD